MQTASIVIAVRGNIPHLIGLLRRLAAQDHAGPLEVVVVDNHRQPRIPSKLLVEFGLSGTVVHEPRAGLSRARNTGIRHVTGEFVLFTDPDARPTRGWVRCLVGALVSTGAYCAGGRVEPRAPEITARWEPGIAQFFLPPAWPERTCWLREPYWLLGCNLATRSEPRPVFDEQLGVRPRWHLSCEDLDLVARAEHAGLGVVVAPDAVVHRAIHAADVRLHRLVLRGFGHGISIARLRRRHPGAAVYDSARVRELLGSVPRGHWRTAAAHLARICGWRLETRRLAHRSPAEEVQEVSTR